MERQTSANIIYFLTDMLVIRGIQFFLSMSQMQFLVSFSFVLFCPFLISIVYLLTRPSNFPEVHGVCVLKAF